MTYVWIVSAISQYLEPFNCVKKNELRVVEKCYQQNMFKNHIYKVVQKVSKLFSYGQVYWLYTHETLVHFEVISSGCNALLVPFQQPLEDPMEVLLCERVNDLCHSLYHLLNCIITTALSFSLSLGNNQKSQGVRSGL